MPASQEPESQEVKSGAAMTDLQQHFGSPVPDNFSVPLGLSSSGQPEKLYAKFSGKVSRYLARHVATKKLAMRNAKPIISFTFDDVPASACDTGVRILEQYGIRGTFYIAGAGFGRNSPVGILATPEELRTAWRRGHEIGCQTHYHSAVSRLSRDELQLEFHCNQDALKKIDASVPVRNFAYPYGDLSFGARRQLEALFDCCRSVDNGINSGVANLGALKSWPLENASLDRSKIAALIAETIRINGWLIFFSHDVGEQPSRFGIDPGLLEWTVKTAKQSGAIVAPIADSLKYAAGSAVDTRRNAHPGPRS
jgi:peptidoglycan/xylan/chitin deacetylase (PgdA/CDA1 family)